MMLISLCSKFKIVELERAKWVEVGDTGRAELQRNFRGYIGRAALRHWCDEESKHRVSI
jgi:hypothetical protein